MRLIFGIIIGASLTIGGAYIADAMTGAEVKPLVNWEVVATNVDAVTTRCCIGGGTTYVRCLA
jgi:hypothetical protein